MRFGLANSTNKTDRKRKTCYRRISRKIAVRIRYYNYEGIAGFFICGQTVTINNIGKLVYLTTSIKNMGITPQVQEITEPPGLHLHDEEGTITSKFQTFFLKGFQSQTRQEQAAMEMVEKHRTARNATLNTYVEDMLNWHYRQRPISVPLKILRNSDIFRLDSQQAQHNC